MRGVLKTIVLIVNLAFVALFVGSTMAGLVAPSQMILFSLLSYGFLYLLIINVAFVIFWLCFKSKWFLLSLAAIVLRWPFLPAFFQIGGTESLSAEEEQKEEVLKVMTFNVHRFSGVERSDASLDSNMAIFLNLVEEEQPDLLAMQEYIGRGDTLHLTNHLTRAGYLYQATAYPGGSMTGTVLFSKLPFAAVHTIDSTLKFYTDLVWKGDTLRCFCLHLDSYRLDESDREEINKITHGNADSLTGRSTLRKFKETILVHEQEWNRLEPLLKEDRYPTLVMGDFNDSPASYVYQQFCKILKDSYCDAGQGFSTTYHGTAVLPYRLISSAFRIDMVLRSSGLKASSYKRVKTEISDHYPVVVTLRKYTGE